MARSRSHLRADAEGALMRGCGGAAMRGQQGRAPSYPPARERRWQGRGCSCERTMTSAPSYAQTVTAAPSCTRSDGQGPCDRFPPVGTASLSSCERGNGDGRGTARGGRREVDGRRRTTDGGERRTEEEEHRRARADLLRILIVWTN